MADLVGSNLGRYRVVEQIGLGGMATIYKAYQPGMDRLVALKVLPQHFARDPRFVERFKREAQIIAKLEHPNIVPIFDFGQQETTVYLAMRYLQAGTVKDILRHGPLSLPDTARLLTEVASALDYAHTQGIIHRDVKPANVLVDKQGHAYLTDFGIAKVLEGSAELTGSAALGTPAYMAPEQTLGKPVTPQTDVYSLGVMLYEMVTGKPPFEADTPMAVALMHVHEPLPWPRTVKPDLPEDVELVILKALAKDPQERFRSAGELAKAFQNAAGQVSKSASEQLIELADAAAANLGGEEMTYDLRQELEQQANAEKLKGLRRWLTVAASLILVLILSIAAVWLSTQVNSIQAQSQQTGTALAYDNLFATQTAQPSTATPKPTLDIRPTQTAQARATATQQSIQLTQAEGTRQVVQQAFTLTSFTANTTHRAATVAAGPTATPSAVPTFYAGWLIDSNQINHIVFHATGCTYTKIRPGPVVFHITVEIWDSAQAARAAYKDSWPVVNISGRGGTFNRYALGPKQDQTTGKWSYEYISTADQIEAGSYQISAGGLGVNVQCTIVVQN